MTFNRKTDPIISNIRTGTTDNPYVAMEESLVVDHNGKIQLTEYPSEFHKVKVIGENQDWHEIRSGIPDVDEYKVDYLHKTITFDVAHAGKQLLFQYQGMGNSLISSKNIYTNVNEGVITETLHDIIETGRDGIDTLGRVEKLETEITQNEDVRKLNETDRVQAEESRKTNETARQRNEEERIDSEEQRKSDELIRNQNEENRTTAEADRVNAETIRKQSEQSRVDAEELRQQQEDIRKTSEESRVNAENNRELNETEREQSESERIAAEILRDTSESDRQEAELVRDSNEQDRVNAENIRRTNEDARSLAEEERISAESIRENNEQDRINAENNRETNEQTRKDNENTRITEHSSRMQEVDHLITNTKFIEEWSSAATYHTNNIVRYNNSSFISLIDNNIGNTPDSTQDTEFWGILALKGVDGKGSVSSVSGKSPDTDGNVDLTASDVDAIPSSEKGIANGVAKLNAEGKVVDANGNEVEGKVKSVNGQTGDVKVNVPTKTSQLENDSNFATTNDVQSVSNEIGDLSQLQTENKDNLVESVNETVSQLAQKVNKGELVVNIKDYGVKGDGLAPDSDAINQAIQDIPIGSTIYFPPGTYLIDKDIILKESINYIASGWNTVFKLVDNAINVDFIIKLPQRTDVYNYGFSFENFLIDGNKVNNTVGGGLYIGNVYTAKLRNIRVINCVGNGIQIDGNETIDSNTVSIDDCYSYGNDGYGLYTTRFTSDIHVRGGDYGHNRLDNIRLESPSSSVQNDTVAWGSREGNGITITSYAPSVQIITGHVEGNAHHGIFIEGDYATIISNKIYDNSEFEGNIGLYDGICIGGTIEKPVINPVIIANNIYSGLYTGTGKHRYSINLGDNHTNAEVMSNSVRYKENGSIDQINLLINGLKEGDILDGVEYISSANRPTSPRNAKYYEVDTKRFVEYDDNYGWVYTLIGKINSDSGIQYVAPGSTSTTVTFSIPRTNVDYVINITPTWDTSFWVTNVYGSNFTINFSTAPTVGSNCYWTISEI